MYKTVYKNVNTGAVIAEDFDEGKAFKKAAKASISIVGKAKGEGVYDAFEALEGTLWEREDVLVRPQTAEEWIEEVGDFYDGIDPYRFAAEMIKKLCESEEGVKFLNKFIKEHDLFEEDDDDE